MGNPITLLELNNLVKLTLKERFQESVWVTAEIVSVQENRSGHCYLELADKRDNEQSVVATARGTVWAFTYRMLKPYFQTTTGRGLEKGMKVLLQVEVVFHEIYGYSLNIKDIDPTFTMGDLERKKREIIEQLKKEGIMEMNKGLELAVLPKTIAVISSPTAAGLGDFINQLESNSYGYKFHIKLFPALMQGDKATDSIVAALDRIYAYEDIFDVVVLIRGGGGQTDLGCFDTYDIAANIAQFPLPVIAGIGHERDETIADMVAWRKVKTPTAAAAFLIECFQEFDGHLEELKSDFVVGVKQVIDRERNRQLLCASHFKQSTREVLMRCDNSLRLVFRKIDHSSRMLINNRKNGFIVLKSKIKDKVTLSLSREQGVLTNYRQAVYNDSKALLSGRKHDLELCETKVRFADPRNILERGYSITRLNGKSVKSISGLQEGDMVETLLADGKLESVITNTKKMIIR